ncbi:MAG TPA: hypothetical protein DCP53_02395 [Elusimicrobia bacterium]|nr:hypothetical protein [Elusimicrobiota bacterium]
MKLKFYILFTIFAICFFTRFIYIKKFNTPVVNDAQSYISIAENILNGKGITDGTTWATRPPAYPIFIASVFLITGNDVFYIKLVQIIVSILICFIIYLLGKSLFSEKVGILSSLFFAIDPFFIYFTELVLTEILFTLFFLVFLLLLELGLKKKDSVLLFILSGFFAGLATHTRSTPFLLPVIFALIYFIRKPKNITVFILTYFLMFVPWTIRNFKKLNSFVPLSTLGGYNLIDANNPFLKFSELGNWPTMPELSKKTDYFNPPPDLDEVGLNKFYTKLALNFIIENPFKFFMLSIAKFIKFWTPWPLFPWPLPIKLISIASHGSIISLAIIGMFLLKKYLANYTIPLVVLTYFTVFHMVFCSMLRYSIPIMPYMYFFAAFTIINFWERYKK